MPHNRVARLVFVLVVLGLLFVIGRNFYKRSLNNALSSAINNNDVSAVGSLLERGADPNTKNADENSTVLLVAIHNSNAEITRLLLDKGADTHWAQQKQRQISLASETLIYNDAPDLINLLLERRLITLEGDSQGSLLSLAVSREKWNTVRLLLAKGAVPTYTDAAACPAAPLRSLLLSKAVNKDKGENIGGLCRAAFEGYSDVVRFLLDKGVNVNGLNQIQDTPLLYAVGGGHIDVVKMLLANGADVSSKDKKGETALQTAQKNHRSDIVALLKQAGARE